MEETDGQIRVNVDLDDKQAQAELNRLTKKIESLNDKIYQEKQARMPLVEQAKKLGVQLDAAKAKLQAMQNAAPGTRSNDAIKEQQETVKSLQAQWDNVVKQVERYDRSISKSESEISRSENRAGELNRQMGETASSTNRSSIASEKFRSILEKLRGGLSHVGEGIRTAFNTGSKFIATAAKQTIKFFGNLNVFSKAIDTFKKNLARLGGMIRRVFVFSVITAGLRAVRGQMSQYLKLNDEFSEALGRIKGALLTAFQPIYEVVVPALSSLLNHLSSVISASAEFIAAIFGTTAKQAQDNAESLYNQAQAAEASGEAIAEEGDRLEEMGDQAKEAEKALASFDEINKLTFNNKDESQQGVNKKLSDEVKPTFGLELSDTVFQTWGEAFDAFLDKILKNGIPKLKRGLSNFATWLNGFTKKLLDMFTFDGVLDKVKELGDEIASALNSLVNQIDWEQIGSSLGSGLNLSLAGLVSFLYGFNWMELGRSLAEMVNGLVERVNWNNFGKLLWAGFKIALETLAGFILGLNMPILAKAFSNTVYGFFNSMIETIQKIQWKEIGLQIVSFLNNIDWIGILSTVATAIAVGLNAAIITLGTIIGDLDWITVGTAIGTAFQNLILGIDWVNLFTSLSDFLIGFANGLIAALSAVDWQAVGTAILNGLASVDWVTLLGSIGELIGRAISAVIQLFFSEEGLSLLWDIGKSIANGILEGLNNALTLGKGSSLRGKKVWTGFGSSSGGFGGRSFSLPQPASSYEIPALARGAVIPPNREFLAVLGDQRSGTNVEAPVSEIEAAVARGVAAAGGSGGPLEIKLILSTKPGIAREMKVELDKETRRRGVKLVQGV